MKPSGQRPERVIIALTVGINIARSVEIGPGQNFDPGDPYTPICYKTITILWSQDFVKPWVIWNQSPRGKGVSCDLSCGAWQSFEKAIAKPRDLYYARS